MKIITKIRYDMTKAERAGEYPEYVIKTGVAGCKLKRFAGKNNLPPGLKQQK